MSDIVFILGAGASKEAGAPLMPEFLDVAHDLWKRGGVKEHDITKFQQVFEAISALQSVHSKSQLDIHNVESVFATLEMAITLDKFPLVEKQDLKRTIEAMKRLISVTIEETMRFPVGNNGVRPPIPYESFADLVQHLREKSLPKHRVSIITFNYDLACDYAFYYAGIPYGYALGEVRSADDILLLKLHGSLNWASERGKEEIFEWQVNEAFPQPPQGYMPRNIPEFRHLRASKHLAEIAITNHSINPEAILVPPTWNKMHYNSNLSSVWSRAARELSEAENIFIIGYSLPESDSFFRYLYALGSVGPTPLKRFWVFNPDQTVDVKFRSILGPGAQTRYRFFQKTFRDSFQIIIDEFPEHREGAR